MKGCNKKGLSPIGILGKIVVVLAVIIILLAIVIVPRIFKQSEIVGGQIGGLQGDADQDGIRNFLDRCPCTFGDSIYEGCPATFTDEQKQEDVKKYNSKTVCDTLEGQNIRQPQASTKTSEQKPEEKKAEQKSELFFRKYQSIELFSQDDDKSEGIIRQACTGFVGGKVVPDCHSESNNCDGKFKPGSKPITEGCWIMVSEDDAEGNDCGQAKIDNGATIPLQGYLLLKVDQTNDYQGDDDPKALFSKPWKSQPQYGALLCSQGYWVACRDANEGQFYHLRNNQAFRCVEGEWIRQSG